jgi:hypothetical protein
MYPPDVEVDKETLCVLEYVPGTMEYMGLAAETVPLLVVVPAFHAVKLGLAVGELTV